MMQFAEAIKANGWPSQLTASLIGSCTNSSYEDMTRSASIVRQALEAGIKVCPLIRLSPPSELKWCTFSVRQWQGFAV